MNAIKPWQHQPDVRRGALAEAWDCGAVHAAEAERRIPPDHPTCAVCPCGGVFVPGSFSGTLASVFLTGAGNLRALQLGLRCAALMMVLLVPQIAFADSVPIVFDNTTGMSSSQIFIQFLGSSDQITGSYSNIFGAGKALQANTAYSLDQLTDPLTGKAQVSVSDFSGRVYVNYGPYGLQGMQPGYSPSAAVSSDPNYLTRYQYWEPTIVPQSNGSTTLWADLSYIDFTAISLSMSARTSSGAVNTTVSNGNQVSAPTQTLVNATMATAVSPALAVMPSGASSTLPNSVFSRVISPQFSANGTYHDFSAYLGSLSSASTGVNLAGTFVGTGSQPTNNINTQAQTYAFTGNFTGAGITLSATALSGNGTVSWIGNKGAGAGSNATITITYAALNSQNGIYGNDAPYSVTVNGQTTNYVSIGNDVWGRVVGDLLAGLSFGYVGSNATFTYNGNATTIGALASSQWWAAGMSNNSTYMPDGTLVTWGNTPAGQGIYFSDVQSNPLFYNGYAASLAMPASDPLTTGYGFPLQDRLGNNLLVFNTLATPDTNLLVSINPDAASGAPIATGLWSGNATDGKWGTAGNWAGNAVPGGNATVQFVGNNTQTVTVDTGGNRSAAGIYFNYAAGSFTIANNTIALSGDIVNSSTKTQTITSALTLGSNSTVTAAFGDLVLGGTIALSNTGTANTLTFSGTQNATVSGSVSDGTAAGGSLVKTGTGILTLSGNNTFSGGLTHQAGTLVLGNDSAAGSGTLTLGNGTLQAAGGTRTLANTLILAGDAQFSGSNHFLFNGGATLAANRTLTNSVGVEFAGAIGGNYSLTKSGSGTMTFSGAGTNTYTGLTTVNEGVLVLNKSAGSAINSGLAIGDGTGTAGSAVVRLGANGQLPAGTNLSVATDGQLDLQSFNASVGNAIFTGGSVTGNGTLAIADGSTVQFLGTGNSSASISSGVALGAGAVTFYTQSNAAPVQMSISGPLSGSGSFTKGGSGVLAITGNNTFSGSVTVSGGMLATSSMLATVSVSTGALSPGGSGTISSITLGGLLSTANTGVLAMDLGAGNASDLITVSTPNGINLANSTVFLFSGAGGGSGNFTLVSGSWQTNPDPATFTFASIDISGLTGTFGFANGNLTFSGVAGVTNTWNGGGGDGSWATLGNWQGGAVPLAGADLVFTGSSQTAVATAGNRTTGAITFDSSADAFAIGGDTITLGGNIANNSSNTQTINAAIALNANRAIAANTGNLSFTGGIALSSTAALPGTLTFTGNQSTSVSGAISDGPATGGSLVKTGAGTLTLTGTNPFTGTLTIAGGVVEANTSAALGNAVTVVTNSLIFDGGTLRAIGSIDSPLNRTIQLLGNGTIDTNGNAVSITGVIAGSGNLIKSGSGSLTLIAPGANSNTYSGETHIQAGSLVINYAGALGSTAGGTTVESGASLTMSTTLSVSGEALTISGTGDGGIGALHLASGLGAWNGTITLGGNASVSADANTTLGLTGSSITIGNSTLTLSAGNAATINVGSTLSGAGGLVKSGSGTVNITSSNSGFTGPVTVENGVLSVSAGTALGNGTAALAVGSGATLQLTSQSSLSVAFSSISLNGTGAGGIGAINNNTANATTVAGPVTLAGDTLVQSSSGALTLSGTISTAGYGLTVLNNSAPMTFSGVISGGGSLAMNTTGSGDLVLSGNNSYSGTTTINTGASLTVASANALGSTSAGTTVANGATLKIQGGVTVAAEPLTLNGAGVAAGGALQNVSGNNTFSGAITVATPATIQSNSGTLTLSGSLSGTSLINIQGPGTVYVSGDTSGYTSTQVNINSGTFASGNMTGAQVNLGPLAGPGTGTPTYSPGNIDHIQTVQLKNLIASGNVTLLMDLGATTSDKIETTNAPSLGAGFAFFFNNSEFSGSGNFTLLTNSAGGIGGGVAASDITFTTNISGLSGTFSYSSPVPYTLYFQASSTAAVWNNGAGNGQWGTGANWALGVTPAGGSAVSFTSANATTVDTQTNRLAGGITFEAGSAALTLANNTVSLYGQILNNSTATQTITSTVSLAGDASVHAAAGNLALNGPVNFGAGTPTLTFTGGNTTTVSGVISNGNATAGNLVKTGAGTLTLTANNTFTGTTSISGGVLVLNGSTAAGNAITVGASGTLAGSGAAAGPVTVAGTLSPGNSPGTLSTGSEKWLNGGNFNWQVFDVDLAAGTGYDTVAITGGLNLADLTYGGFSVNLWSLSVLGPDTNGNALHFVDTNNYSWTLVSTTTGITGFSAGDFTINIAAINGTAGFSNPFTGTFSVDVSGNTLQLNYTAVPESSTCVLFGFAALGLGALGALRRRRLS